MTIICYKLQDQNESLIHIDEISHHLLLKRVNKSGKTPGKF